MASKRGQKASANQGTPRAGFLSRPLLKAASILGALAGIIGYFGVISDALVPSIEGCWDIVDEVVTAPNRGLQLQFRVSISQDGRRFSASGEKTHENGRYLPASGHTRIEIKQGGGSIALTTASATFIEYGTVRPTNGSFRWNVETESLFSRKARALNGEFAATAENSSGHSTARRCGP